MFPLNIPNKVSTKAVVAVPPQVENPQVPNAEPAKVVSLVDVKTEPSVGVIKKIKIKIVPAPERAGGEVSGNTIRSPAPKEEYKRWCFTSFNMETKFDFEASGANYMVYGLEVCPDTGRQHWQGYIEWKRAIKLSTVQNRIGHGAIHCEPARANWELNRKYCTKDKQFWEHGSPLEDDGQGARNDIKAAWNAICHGAKEGLMWHEHTSFMTRYHKAYDRMKRFVDESYDKDIGFQKPEVIVIMGPTGCGKSRYARSLISLECKREPFVLTADMRNGKTLWFDGYEGHDHIIIEDYHGWTTMNTMLTLCDGYSWKFPVKGGFVSRGCGGGNIYITTTCTEPTQWWKDSLKDDDRWLEFKRRVTLWMIWDEAQKKFVQDTRFN